ncbi:ABC transporter substrate-binding protein [Paroceanicella profunda]|uniref:ABC transporter substrate-binding protein n=1 Tax=Paroceanicella profunda TaxID=2579971 RepID=A0A5B8FGN0_9RHOB|nr:CmpA/NrtA family ABC transporter substrate-binding protein [Paroceanicella profunda]QDL91431.1 ABC transporter substrate-binding protein [Paroceanicella profunda]
MSLAQVECGFVALTDSALLVAALEMGFAAEEGVDLVLRREASWSSIRDKVSLGVYPMAHMLAPLPLAMSLGLGPVPAEIVAPFVLGLDGNTLTAARPLAAELRDLGAAFGDADATARALVRRARRDRLRVGVPYPHSMHRELVRLLMERGGGDADRDFDMVVAPPSLLSEVLMAGEVDMVMVGEPWGSVAVERGAAEMLLTGASIRRHTREKVLGVRRDWAEENAAILAQLMRALARAGAWAGKADSLQVLAEILCLPTYLDCPSPLIEQALRGAFVIDGHGHVGQDPCALLLDGGALCIPDSAEGLWLADRVSAPWGIAPADLRRAATTCFADTAARTALAPLGITPG